MVLFSRLCVPLAAAFVSLVVVLLLSTESPAQYSATGRWTMVGTTQWDKKNGTTLVSGGGTHMALLRGNADSSWVLHWHEGAQARVWLTTPMDSVGVGVSVGYNSVNVFLQRPFDVG